MAVETFYGLIEAEIFAGVLGLGIFAWASGYGIGYVQGRIRQFANMAV